MASLTHYLESRLKLQVNREKSAVDRPWKRSFLGYTVTHNRVPRLKPAPASVRRAKDRIREIMQRGLGQNIHRVIAQINVFTRGWFGYFRLATVKHAFALLDQWMRLRLRKILWEQWKKPKTRYRNWLHLEWRRNGRARPPPPGAEPGGMPGPRTCTPVYIIGYWQIGPPQPTQSTSDPAAVRLNRRVRSRTHGGVGGREGRPSLLPDNAEAAAAV